jgi:maltose/moltooligosaccharide transporter
MNRFPYRRTFLLGFGFMGVSILWSVYNAYVPVFLEQRFALSALAIGFIMTLDNMVALYIQPLIGVVSDNTRTRIGRRMPYILIGAPIAAIGFVLIPLMFGFGGFIAAIGVTLFFMALWRTPVIALLGDLFPSEQRSKANGVINFMGGVGGILAYFGGGILYGLNTGLPFWIGGVLIVVAIGILFWRIKEPIDVPAPTQEGYGQLNKILPGLALLILAAILWFLGLPHAIAIVTGLAGFAVFLIQQLQGLPSQNRTSLVLLLLAIFSWFVGFSAIEAFFTLYGRNVLGIRENLAAILFGISNVTFILFAIPSGIIATRFGRRRTILIGLAIFAVLLAAGFFVPKVIFIGVMLGLGGMAWALVNVNSLPMVLDTAPQDRVGTSTGLYYLFSTLAAVAGPITNGWVIDLTGRNYNMIMAVAPFFMVLALLLMLGVRKGEALVAPEAQPQA